MSTGTRWVILLAFANDRLGGEASYLRNLAEESRRVRAALDRLDRDRIEVVYESNVTPEVLFDLLAEHNDRLIGFHFGGHADGASLHLEQRDGTPAELHRAGLAARLGRLPQLRWIFLNGCATAPQVDELHAQSTVPVIATEQAIDDGAATRFAASFYRSLVRHRSLAEAFADAEDEVRAGCGDDDERVRRDGSLRLARPAGPLASRWPWTLRPHPDASGAVDWRLPGGEQKTPARERRFIAPLIAGLVSLVLFGVFVTWGRAWIDGPPTDAAGSGLPAWASDTLQRMSATPILLPDAGSPMPAVETVTIIVDRDGRVTLEGEVLGDLGDVKRAARAVARRSMGVPLVIQVDREIETGLRIELLGALRALDMPIESLGEGP